MEMKELEEELFIGPVLKKWKRPIYNIKQSIEFYRKRDELLNKHKQLIQVLESLTDLTAIEQVNTNIINTEDEIYLLNQLMHKYISVDNLKNVVNECIKYHKVSMSKITLETGIPYNNVTKILSKGFKENNGFKVGIWAIREFDLDANKYLKDL